MTIRVPAVSLVDCGLSAFELDSLGRHHADRIANQESRDTPFDHDRFTVISSFFIIKGCRYIFFFYMIFLKKKFIRTHDAEVILLKYIILYNMHMSTRTI